eukprot:8355557-Pyramimonas_sp.AAC.1
MLVPLLQCVPTSCIRCVTFSIFHLLACTLLRCFDNAVFSVAKAVVSHQAIWSIIRETSGYQPKVSPELDFWE